MACSTNSEIPNAVDLIRIKYFVVVGIVTYFRKALIHVDFQRKFFRDSNLLRLSSF
jgi:hypothetical protein